MTAFYLAGRYGRRLELCRYGASLELDGHTVTSRWLLGDHQVHGADAAAAVEAGGPVPIDQARRFAHDDLEDILAADILICFTEPPETSARRGGRHVEFGVALGFRLAGNWQAPKAIWVAGPVENIFYSLPQVDHVADTFADLHAWMRAR